MHPIFSGAFSSSVKEWLLEIVDRIKEIKSEGHLNGVAKERSAVSKVTELEKINEELRAQIRHPGVKHIVNTAAVQTGSK